MKYQAIKQLKTKSKLLKMCDTLQEAHNTIKNEGATFQGFSYMGGFPMYDGSKHTYTIQGAFMCKDGHIVCSLDDKEKATFNFTN